MEDQATAKIRELERRVDQLTTVAVVQSLGLALLLWPLIPIVAIGFLFLLPILAFTHKLLPGLARRCGQLLKFVTNLLMPLRNPPPSANQSVN